MKNGAATQCRCENGRNVESFLTFGFPDGSSEVSQCSDNSIVHHQNHWGVFVCTRYAYCRLRYVSGQLSVSYTHLIDFVSHSPLNSGNLKWGTLPIIFL